MAVVNKIKTAETKTQATIKNPTMPSPLSSSLTLSYFSKELLLHPLFYTTNLITSLHFFGDE